MASYVNEDKAKHVEEVMFREFGNTPEERFLKKELIRYVPQFAHASDEETAAFVDYQRSIYLLGKVPTIGIPIASFNPTFTDSLAHLKMSDPDLDIYTRASIKENGFRFQLHNGVFVPVDVKAFTRQFTPYDLRMFPELKGLYQYLPVMIGDSELVNAVHKHLAGFHRVEMRFPGGNKCWPKRGSDGLEKGILEEYLQKEELFKWGVALPDMRLMLAFHGMFAIAHPDTWDESREVQAKNMISLCSVPVNYKRVDRILTLLERFIKRKQIELCVRVVERFVSKDKEELRKYVSTNELNGLEGTCIAQFATDKNGKPVVMGKTIKVKTYETVDAILLGLNLLDKSAGLVEGNLKGAIVGIWDYALHMFLPALKVNLDPNGVQVKTDGQRERLTDLGKNILAVVKPDVSEEARITTLYDVFKLQGAIKIKFFLASLPRGDALFKKLDFEKLFGDLPRGHDLATALAHFEANPAFEKGKLPLIEKYIVKHYDFFNAISKLDEKRKKKFIEYFSEAGAIKTASQKLLQPHVVVDVASPVILETKVFGLEWGLSPFAAGFHTWYSNGFHFDNCFAERVRYDKQATTDYQTLYVIAKMNTAPKVSKKKKQKSLE